MSIYAQRPLICRVDEMYEHYYKDSPWPEMSSVSWITCYVNVLKNEKGTNAITIYYWQVQQATGLQKAHQEPVKSKAKKKPNLLNQRMKMIKSWLGDQGGVYTTYHGLRCWTWYHMSFKVSVDTIEKIHNRPKFGMKALGNDIAQTDIKRLEDDSIGAEALKATVAGSALE